jgi:hypothetical protein
MPRAVDRRQRRIKVKGWQESFNWLCTSEEFDGLLDVFEVFAEGRSVESNIVID